MLQPRQNNLFTRLFDLASQKHLIQNSIDLVKVEDKIQLTHVAKELIQHLDEEMNGLQISKLVIICVDASAKEEASVTSIYDFGGAAKLDEIRLVFLVAGRHETVDLAF